MDRSGLIQHVRYGTVWNGAVRGAGGAVRYGAVRCGTVRYGTVRYGADITVILCGNVLVNYYNFLTNGR